MLTLQKLLKAKAINQVQLAKRAGVSLITIRRLAQNRAEPCYNTLRKLEAVLGVEVYQVKFEDRRKVKRKVKQVHRQV